MKTVTIRLPDADAAMLVEVQKRNKAFRDISGFAYSRICEEY
jgi:hypothetical protein